MFSLIASRLRSLNLFVAVSRQSAFKFKKLLPEIHRLLYWYITLFIRMRWFNCCTVPFCLSYSLYAYCTACSCCLALGFQRNGVIVSRKYGIFARKKIRISQFAKKILKFWRGGGINYTPKILSPENRLGFVAFYPEGGKGVYFPVWKRHIYRFFRLTFCIF